MQTTTPAAHHEVASSPTITPWLAAHLISLRREIARKLTFSSRQNVGIAIYRDNRPRTARSLELVTRIWQLQRVVANRDYSMTAKLNIDLKQGLLHVEGTEEFVRAIYDDYKNQLTAAATVAPAPIPPAHAHVLGHNNSKAEGRKTSSKPAGKRSDFTPVFNRNLDTSKLSAFYNQFDTKNHPEKVLVFAHFLKDELHIEPITGSDIFTCYVALKSETKAPKAFAQALRDAAGKLHLIEVRSWEDIVIPIAGTNYFHHSLKRKGSE